MASVGTGLVGGLVGAAVTAAMLRSMRDDPDLPAVVWGKFLGDGDPAHYEVRGTAVHVGYGTLAGAGFAILAGALSLGLSALPDALLAALGWSVFLAVVAVVFWGRLVVGRVPDAESLATTAAVHLVYGLVLGLVVYALAGA